MNIPSAYILLVKVCFNFFARRSDGFQISEDGVFITKQGKINFVDLAGSEMTKKTMSEGKTLEEANNINKSLMVLGMVTRRAFGNKQRKHY